MTRKEVRRELAKLLPRLPLALEAALTGENEAARVKACDMLVKLFGLDKEPETKKDKSVTITFGSAGLPERRESRGHPATELAGRQKTT